MACTKTLASAAHLSRQRASTISTPTVLQTIIIVSDSDSSESEPDSEFEECDSALTDSELSDSEDDANESE